jgi:uncharacterized protein
MKKISISSIVKANGAILDIEFSDNIEGLNSVGDEFQFNDPVTFKGQLMNYDGLLKLVGHLETKYTAKCHRCLNDIERKIAVDIKESFYNKGSSDSIEGYTYEGNYIEIDKALRDNIILNIPSRHICIPDCKGLCPKCGKNLNTGICECKDEEPINPKMKVLKKFFNN